VKKAAKNPRYSLEHNPIDPLDFPEEDENNLKFPVFLVCPTWIGNVRGNISALTCSYYKNAEVHLNIEFFFLKKKKLINQ